MEEYDSATIMYKKGLEIALKNKTEISPAYFTQAIGITAYFQKNYNAGLDSLKKTTEDFKAINDPRYLVRSYLYMGKIYQDQGKTDEAAMYFEEVDAIFENTSYVFPEIKEAYTFLIEYYEKKANAMQQLKYRERLELIKEALENVIIHESFRRKAIHHEDENIVGGIVNAFTNFKTSVLLIMSLIFITSGIIYFSYKKQYVYPGRFRVLLAEKSIEKLPSNKGKISIKEELKISEKALNNITEKLKTFIEEKQFLSNTVSLNELAKAMDTNPNYLSRFINFYEQKNFSAYIKDLRINYAVAELKTNAIFRKYSIKAIAEELGFNNEQSFSKAFYKKTGIYPSYFIKELEKEMLRKRSA